MADLVEKYFKADLTEAEQQALSGELLSSEDAALKFEGLAKEAYLRYGWPEPQPHWPNDPPLPKPPLQGLSPWIGMSVVIVGVGLGWLFWKTYQPDSITKLGSSGVAPVKTEDIPKKSLPKTASAHQGLIKPDLSQSKVAPTGPGGSTAGQGSPASGTKPTNPSNSSVGTSGAVHTQKPPINLDQNPSQSFSGLSVEISLAHPAPLSVRVLDTSGVAKTLLYQGTLGAGNWVFEWDGQLSDGKPAQPGFYRIEVRSGSYVQYKKIQIQ